MLKYASMAHKAKNTFQLSYKFAIGVESMVYLKSRRLSVDFSNSLALRLAALIT